ncbi:DUF3440 domain-containing protein [Enterococcus termitis]|uniref:Phosphoadenosine phosphosulfate sulfurtransferase n=1 Tax=Enterococcus termitis TaxID=332950 RepID=A0A1E5GKK6_9ENTE|nr:DUF3440 domain-containing protein [Enterococcus termitis]OEG12770.1 phosphoadenosine phosphosulfate sulfurtransferase [Enterococcus termitis]
MGKSFLGLTVYDAFMNRMEYIFQKFDHIVIAFSGGKDSGLLLELVNLYYQKHKTDCKVSVYHIDYEGNYQKTIEYVNRCMEKYPYFTYYHLCMPISASSGVSMYQSTWLTWDPANKNIWFRELPDNSINLDNHPFDFFEIGMADYDFQMKFGKWLHKKNNAKRTAVLVGIRAQESLHRYHAVTRNDAVTMFGKISYSRRIAMNIFNFYPLYDWTTEDVWRANGKFNFDYNHLYDLYYAAGVPLGDMRVANPFHDCGVNALRLYQVIEPVTWTKLVGRVNGANFAAIYGGTTAVGYKNIHLPDGHTWKTYANFLLKSLPEITREIYLKKFRSSIAYWTETGGTLPVHIIHELKVKGIEFENLGKPHSKRKYKNEYEIIRFSKYPDEIDIKEFRSVPSYKRMCITILKNDTSCKYMGFAQTKDELQKQKGAMEQWENSI